jgi:ABC-type Fe3+-siderophore transport system permease subunit
MKDRKVILSTLWIFAMFNYLYADVFTLFFNPTAQQDALQVTQGSGFAVLAFAVLMETAMAMVLLSRILKYGANRWANILAGALHTALVAWSASGGMPEPFYILFATIEITCTLFIIWYSWTWPKAETQVPTFEASRS